MRPKDIHKKVCAGMRDDWTGYNLVGTDVVCDAGKAILYDETSGYWKTYDVPEKTIALVTGINRIYVRLNAGVAEFQSDQVVSFFPNLETNSIIAIYLYDATGIQLQPFEDFCLNVASKTAISITSRADAIFYTNNPDTVLQDNASDHVLIESLVAFRGPEFLSIDAFDSNAVNNDLYIYYWNGSAWVKETPERTTFERTRYQGASGLLSVTPNQWTVNYVFKSLFKTADGNPNETFIILGNNSYGTAALAKADTTNLFPLALPIELGYNAVLVGRIIAENAATSAIVNGRYFAKPQYTD